MVDPQRVQELRAKMQADGVLSPSTVRPDKVQELKAKMQAPQPSKAGPLAKKATEPQKKTVGGFLKNTVKSAGRLVGDTAKLVAGAVFQPQKTLKTITDPMIGAVGLVAPSLATDEQKDAARGVGQFYKDRYGSADAVKETLYNDPVGVASDVSAVTGAVGGLSKLGGLNRAAKVASIVSEVANPLNAVKVIPGKKVAASALRTSAEKSYTEALAPTTKVNKAKAAKVVPGLLEKRVTAFSKEGLQAKAVPKVNEFGQQIEDAFDAIPDGVQRIDTRPVFEDLQRRKMDYVASGVVIDELGYKAFDDLQRKLLKVADVDVSPKSIREFRQILDRGTARNGNFSFTDADSAAAEARKAAANAMREELAKANPDIDAINKEFSFWNNVDDVISDTIKRQKPQTGLIEPMAQIVGTATGTGGIMQAVLRGLALRNFIKLTRSTGWKTVSAVAKNDLANLLSKGDTFRAGTLINKLLNTASTVERNLMQPADNR